MTSMIKTNTIFIIAPGGCLNIKMLYYLSGYSRIKSKLKLEQLERLRSEDPPRRLMITHTIEWYWIPSQKKSESKLQI